LITGKSYVGSANCLSNRFKKYFSAYNIKEILKTSKSVICNSLLKNGYENFQLEILEYIVFHSGISIKEKKEVLLGREQYYLDLLKPEYNILRKAGSHLGAKHISKSIDLMREKALAHKHSEKTLLKLISIRGCPVGIYEKSDSEVFQSKGSFVSARKAAEFLGISNKTVCTYKKSGKIFKDKYKFLRFRL
jgi:hypothetical protein